MLESTVGKRTFHLLGGDRDGIKNLLLCNFGYRKNESKKSLEKTFERKKKFKRRRYNIGLFIGKEEEEEEEEE